MFIRLANNEDLDLIDQVYRESITKLCANDYEQAVLLAWKNRPNLETRIADIALGRLWVVESFNRSPLGLTPEQRLGEGSLWGPECKQAPSGLAGFMVVSPGEIVSLFIHPDFSGLGVGKKLAEIGIQIAKKGQKVVQLESTINAVSFYQKLGFVEQSRGFFSHGSASLKIPVVNMTLSFL